MLDVTRFSTNFWEELVQKRLPMLSSYSIFCPNSIYIAGGSIVRTLFNKPLGTDIDIPIIGNSYLFHHLKCELEGIEGKAFKRLEYINRHFDAYQKEICNVHFFYDSINISIINKPHIPDITSQLKTHDINLSMVATSFQGDLICDSRFIQGIIHKKLVVINNTETTKERLYKYQSITGFQIESNLDY